MDKDKIFATKKEKVTPFRFNKAVTLVFDDMLNRSVPLYQESIQRQAQLTKYFYQKKTRIYDLGCSHGNLGIRILNEIKESSFSMVAVDSSVPMVEKYSKRLKLYTACSNVDLVCGFLENVKIKNASVVLINLTLQFLKPETRDDLIKKIYKGMAPGGVLLLTEKIIQASSQFDALQLNFYDRFKRENGYSQLEISQKRDALEKVLIPDTIQIHEDRFSKAGFSSFDVWLKWFNFASMMAIK
ncbi:MAG: carboxy-S-adenosyl-L-methionine synthase CmoA [Desulfobacula sp.]|nr:carboxy-S-adenosyl-L-methionine synthase CmoA [Desulfobacula sp.]